METPHVETGNHEMGQPERRRHEAQMPIRAAPAGTHTFFHQIGVHLPNDHTRGPHQHGQPAPEEWEVPAPRAPEQERYQQSG